MRSIGGGGVGWWLGSGSGTGVQKPDELVILRNQNQTLLSIRIWAAVFINVIVYPATLQFVTISFFFKNARAYCTFSIYLAKPLSNAPINVMPAGGWGGVGGGIGWGFDFFRKFAIKFPAPFPSFQSNATKFPHPRLHIAVNPKAEPKKGTIKIFPNKTLQSFINVAASPKICSCYSCNYTF